MNIKVWTGFSKRKNSTKQPSGGTQITVRLKDNCSVEAPVFILSGGLPDYNYVEAFGHYYFVSDIVSLTADVCEIHCAQDCMATYKTDIGNTTAFVLYDGTSNSTLEDTRLPKVSTATVSKNKTKLHANLNNVGSFIVTTTGMNSTNCYVISVLDVNKLVPNVIAQINTLFYSDPPFVPAGDWSDFIPGILRAIRQIMSSGNITDNIRDLRWIPFDVSGVGSHSIYVGCYDTGITGGYLSLSSSLRIDARTASISIPWQYSDWRNAFCTDMTLYLPFVGVVSIPADKLIGDTGISLNVSADMVTGDMCIVLTGTTTGIYLGCYGASTGVTIPIGNSGTNLQRLATSLIGGLGSVRSAGSIGGMVSALGGAIGGIAEAAFNPITQSVGGLSSAAAAKLPFDAELVLISHNTNVTPSSISASMGTPTFAQKQISSCPAGYIQCQNASVETTAKDADRDIINGYLNSGFFYE